MNHKQLVDDAIAASNKAERAEFMATTGTTWLGLDGPTYLLGDARAKAMFVGKDGRHWTDAYIVIESISQIEPNPGLMEAYRQLIACDPDAEGMWVWTDTRGHWDATMAPIEIIAERFGYPPPLVMPGDNWARTWWDTPERTDAQEIAWLAHGGIPLNRYRTKDQL